MAGMVVGDVVVNLGENVDGGTRCHHQENQNHDGNARHFEVRKDFHVVFGYKETLWDLCSSKRRQLMIMKAVFL